MRSFRYKRASPTSYPSIVLSVSSGGSRKSVKTAFRLDTGADVTVVPFEIIGSLDAMVLSDVAVADFDMNTFVFKTYSLNLRFDDHFYEEVEVIASEGNVALLGLDILNELNVRLDGPKQRLSIL